jgi:hypothetical protein
VTLYRRFRALRRVVGDVRFIWWAIGAVAALLGAFLA